MMIVQQGAPFSGLHLLCVSWYSFAVAAKSAAGRGNPSNPSAIPDAPCVFFCVYAYVHLLFTHRFLSRCCICVMVAQAGQPSGWPVLDGAGISTPVWAIAIERGNSGDSNFQLSIGGCLMATILTPSHPQFVFVFAAVRRADRQPRICMLRAVAGDEHAARLSLVRDYVLSFAGRLPVAEVRA